MARSGSSSRFVSVNLNKSYGQPPSPSTSHGGSSASASASPSPGLSRPRVPNSHVGMVLLSRSSGRSQPSVSSAASASSRASKLAVPRPVNLPSLRREHAGNDPTIALVGASGSSGWTKQQVSAFHGDSPVAQPGVPVDSASVRSASMTIESSWGSPVSQGRVTPSLADVASMEQRLPSYQASTGRPAVYTPPGSRNASAINPVPVQYPPSEKAVIVRGEDFPTLQAAARPTAVPAPHRQRDMQQKQRDRQHELKDQHMKLQQLSQQQNNTEDVLHLEHHSGPQLQPAQPVRPQVRSQQPSSVEGRSYETRGVTEKAGCHFFGPSPLIRSTHTSNWADDERETLQSVRPQRMAQSDRLDSGRPRNGYQFSDSWVLDHSGAADLGRPSSRNGSLSGFGRDPRDLRDYEKNGSLGFEGRVSKDGGFSNAIVKGFQGDQLEVGLRDDIGHWGRGVGRNDFPKRDWGSAAKESNHNRDARLGNSSRSFSNRNNGLERDMNASTFRDADPTLRGDSLGRDMSTREVHSRDGSFRKDAFFSKHGLDDWQGDRPRKSAVGHQFGRSDSTSTGRPHAGARNDLNGLEYGREKRANVYGPDPFLEDPVGSKASSFFAVEAFVGMSGLEAKIPRRKKDELQNYRDPARELFEAELERVQKMQEQERQRMVEERERAIELARKEEEEREMLAREEELLRLKIEEEAREAVAQAEREVEEAAKKAEELRRAREEEKRMVILEEERRKEAARRKLLELEERIAKRESTQQQRGYSVREVSMGSFETARTAEMDVEDEDRLLPGFGKAEQNDECASLRLALPLQSPARREPVEIPNSHPRLSGSALRWPPDTRGGEMASVERNRVVQMRRRETLDDGPGLSLVSTQSHPRDDLPQLEHELEYRGFPLRDSNLGARRSSASGASRSSSLTYTQERVQAERSTRKEQQWVSGQNEGFSGRHFSSDINAGYMDNGNERDADGWWGRDNRRRSQEGQRLTSPPLPFYLNGGEGDYPSFGRLRQSLPKQPRVPPPILGRATLHRQTVHPEDTQAVPSTDRNDNSEGSHKDSPNSSSQGAAFEADIAEKVDIVDRPPSDAGRMLENLDSAASTEVSVLLNGNLQVFDDTVEDGSSNGSQTCHEQGSHLNEIDAVSELTECEERLEEDETHTAVDMQETRTEESIGDDEDWLVQAREARAEEMGEEVRVHDCLHLQNEVAIDELEDQEWESSNVHQDEGDGQERVNTTEVEEANWESQQMEEVGDGVMDDPDMPADSQWESDVYTPECEQQAETEVKDPALQDAVEDHVVQPLIQQHSLPPANAFDSVQVGQSEGLSHGQSLLQQFQQPFSFMAVPLPQSTTSNSVLSSMHGFQTQQELPYHLQMGLLPGTPLMPNAIQIGSIQMPLHVHPQMPQLAHLHHQQPPVFQFGQICHSVPFSQPLPPMQPTVQIHHAIGQPLLPQHHQAESLIPVDGSHGLPKFDQVLKGVNEMAMQSFNGLSAGFNLSVDRAVEVDTILGSGLSSGEQNDHSSVVVSAAKSTDVQTPLPVVEIGSSLSGADVNIEANQGTSAGRISGGRRRNNGPWSYGILGRGRGRLRSGKNHGYKGPYSVAETWPETGTREISRNRMFRRNFRRAEYKVRKPLAAFDGDPGVGMSQGKHLSSYAVDLSVSSRLESTERKPNEGPQEESRNYLYSRSLGGANTQNVESVPGSHPMQAGSKSNQADGGQTDTVRNRLTSSSQTKGVLKKYKSDDAGDAPLQTGVVFVFEQPGIEIQNDKDDFIEVRSKRQIVREQRELRDKAKMKEFKVKEQVARKQQKLSVKAVQYEEAAVASSSKHGIERWSLSSAEMVNREGRRAKQSPSAAFGSALPQFSATSTSIGTSASESCDDSQKTSKVSKSGQGQSMSIATHIESGKMLAYGHRYRSNAPDSTPSINAAWGVQRSSHEVVSLTQIQLEEAMKPFRFEGMPSQMAPISERGSTVLESGISLASGLALEKAPAPVKAPVSVPGPISSLLAGEKIQFGAVTSPTVISSGSHPTSPSFIGAIGSPLGFGADMTNIPTHPLSHARNFLGPDSNGSFTSNKISTTGEDNVHGQLVDPEAEAEAAASAVAVAAISNDETVGNHSDASTAIGGGGPVGNFSSFANSSGVEVIRPVIIQAPSISLGIDDSMVVALPADLSVETPAPLLQATLPSVPATSGLMLQSLPSRASPFPCLEMGTILGGPIFAFSPCEDAPLAPLEPGLAALGAGSVAGWQHRHSSTSDSFYGAPPPFMGPAGLPSIQGHPHMLVYTNPFTPVGQFGQLGVSFMGTAYHPSGKQPDWTHTPFTSSSGALNQNGGDMNAGLPGMMDPQHSSGAPNSVQAISVAGCSMMPVATPISLFDPNLSAPFQAQWSRAPAPPFPNYPLSGPAPGLNLQPRNSSAVPGDLGLLSQPMHMSNGIHQLPETSSPFLSGDVGAARAVRFPDELGLGYSVISSNPLLNDADGSSTRGHTSSSASAEVSGSKSHQGRRISQSSRGNSNLATSSSRSEPFLGTQDARGNRLEASHLQTRNPDHQQRASGHHPNSPPFMDKRASQQAPTRGSLGADWAGSNQRKGSSRTVTVDRVSVGERGSASSSKLKQIYVAKPAAPTRNLDAA